MSFHPIEHFIIVNMITILYSTLVLQLAPTEIVYQCIVKPSGNTPLQNPLFTDKNLVFLAVFTLLNGIKVYPCNRASWIY